MSEEKKRLPVGVENFEQLIKDNYYYIDKTGWISELLCQAKMIWKSQKIKKLCVIGNVVPLKKILVSLRGENFWAIFLLEICGGCLFEKKIIFLKRNGLCVVL